MSSGVIVSAAASRHWPPDKVSLIPHWVYTDPEIYQRELERIFYGPHWCYVGLEAEIPEPGNFKETRLGERSVLVVRDLDGAISVIQNKCAHRGVQFCQERRGTAREFICPYHQWNYDLKGRLIGLPFKRGLRGVGGMPADFEPGNHGLTVLRVASRHGVIFASFHADVPDFASYLGADMLRYFDRVFDGRRLRLLGVSRQRIPANWKLMQENIKDPYHPGLLHTWFVTFGLWRADQTSQMMMDATGRHACMISRRNQGGSSEVTRGVASFRDDLVLNDPRLLDVVIEPWWQGPTVVMQTIFPNLIIQQQVNSLSTRHIQPRGPGSFDFVWTHFGFTDDETEMTQRRLRQANLFGPAGYVSADDGEVIEFSQQGFKQDDMGYTVCQLGGHEVGGTDHMITETLLRGMYRYYRKVMEI